MLAGYFIHLQLVYTLNITKRFYELTTAEHTAYPANPDSEYGWEKLFSEHLYLAYYRNKGLDVRIARLTTSLDRKELERWKERACRFVKSCGTKDGM